MDGLVFLKMFYSCLTTGNILSAVFCKEAGGLVMLENGLLFEYAVRHEVWDAPCTSSVKNRDVAP